jgi:RNA polymerase sigma factor (TIGR02999 family)
MAGGSDVTRILDAAAGGDPHAAERLLPLVYDELRKLAGHRLAQEKPGQTLQATALVHEAYLRLVGGGGLAQDWSGRGHFFAAAAEAMRRILVDQARRRGSAKRGGGMRRVDLADIDAAGLATPAGPQDPSAADDNDLLALDEALTQFEAVDPDKARLVKLRYFAGLSLQDAADALGISVATAKRHWVYARSWLYGRLRGQ